MAHLTKDIIEGWFRSLQDNICRDLEYLDGGTATFREDLWKRAEGGGGRSRALKNGNLIEKGGVNFSAVSGPTPDKIIHALNLPACDFFATGVSIVLHPHNPWVPIIHMNVRYFEMSNGTWWVGGGIDLTPHYVIPAKARDFHATLKATCDKHDLSFYPKFKKWADDYFFVTHRGETRGIGGIFFDRLTDNGSRTKEQQWNFVQDIGNTFVPAYTQAVVELRDRKWTNTEKEWQKIRRGRYVEFNLVHDKGTKFGLDTNGRTESILMSMPPEANWEYEHAPQPAEVETLSYLKKGIDWI